MLFLETYKHIYVLNVPGHKWKKVWILIIKEKNVI